MSEFAAWTGEGGEDPPAPPSTAAAGSWLPASVQRRMAAEDRTEAREDREAQRAREAAAEAAADRALGAYRAAAEARGETVSAMALATGQVAGRSLEDVFADAVAAADHEDARQAAKAKREAGIEPDHVMVGRSDGWPGSGYEVDSLIARSDQLHRDRIAYQARQASRQGRAAGHIEAQRAAANRQHDADLRRDQPTATLTARSGPGAEVITRYAPTPACDGCGHIRCRCGL